jgi:hypothetical protein
VPLIYGGGKIILWSYVHGSAFGGMPNALLQRTDPGMTFAAF